VLVIEPMSDVSSLLGEAWERWADRCAELTDDEWSTPTRCRPWDVHALAAHVAPDPAVIGQLSAAGSTSMRPSPMLPTSFAVSTNRTVSPTRWRAR
jgi:hypothetical protein